MSLANIKGKLSRSEMKNIMAGSGDAGMCGQFCNQYCFVVYNGSNINGTCTRSPQTSTCYCSAVIVG